MIVAFLVVTVVATPASFMNLAFPDVIIAMMLLSLNFRVMPESSDTSTLPSLPKLTTALEPLAVVTVAPEVIVEFETAAWPFTVT